MPIVFGILTLVLLILDLSFLLISVADLDLQCFQKKDKSGLSRTMVMNKTLAHVDLCIIKVNCLNFHSKHMLWVLKRIISM